MTPNEQNHDAELMQRFLNLILKFGREPWFVGFQALRVIATRVVPLLKPVTID
jgi:hypothetical protein